MDKLTLSDLKYFKQNSMFRKLLSIYKLQNVCMCPIIVKTAEPIGSNLCVATHMSPRNAYIHNIQRLKKMLTFVSFKNSLNQTKNRHKYWILRNKFEDKDKIDTRMRTRSALKAKNDTSFYRHNKNRFWSIFRSKKNL